MKFAKIATLLKGYRAYAAAIPSLALLNAVLSSFGLVMIFPIVQYAVDGGFEGRLGEFINPLLGRLPAGYAFPALCMFFIGSMALKLICAVLYSVLGNSFTWRLRRDWSEKIFERYMGAELSYINNQRQGKLVGNMMSEILRAAICVQSVICLSGDLLMMAFLYATCFLVDVKITLVMSFISLAVLGAMMWVARSKSTRLGRARISAIEDANACLVESLAVFRQVKLFNAEHIFRDEFNGKIDKLSKVETYLYILRDVPAKSAEFMIALLIGGVLLALYYSSGGQMKEFIPTFAALSLLGMRLLQSAMQFSGGVVQITSTYPSLDLTMDMADGGVRQESTEKGRPFGRLDGDIAFKDVCFGYSEGNYVLKDFNCVFQKGKMTALVGRSGSGKTTVVDIIAGLYAPQSGHVLVNGLDISEWRLADWRRRIGYVTQDPCLFNMSIADNIALGAHWRECSREETISAAKKAHAHEFICSLPGGYDTVVGERGAKLSGGQRQRIAIARSLIREPDILIFDEATSALDNESEKLIQSSIEEIAKSTTVIVIAHRLSTIENADCVIDLDGLKVNTSAA